MQTKKKTRVAVLVGGPSSEHEVSLKSGAVVARALDPSKYEARRVTIDKRGEWEIPPETLAKQSDVAFIAMHGTYGEDGTVQRMLEDLGMAYTGSDALASALGMNKFLSTRHFRLHGLPIPVSILVSRGEWGRRPTKVMQEIRYYVGYPLVVKPNNQGSSVGVSVVSNEEGLGKALEEVFLVSREALAQQFIEGRELTCGVLDYGWPESAYPLLPTEIIPRISSFFDYRAKYEPGGSLEITPPHLPDPIIRVVQRMAVTAHRAIGCSGFSRTDMLLNGRGEVYLLEVNTIPGLTEQSLLPKAAEASGIPFREMLHRVIGAALFRKEKSKK